MNLNDFLKNIPFEERLILANKVDRSLGHLRHVAKGRKQAGFQLAQAIEDATEGRVPRHELRPDIYPPEDCSPARNQ